MPDKIDVEPKSCHTCGKLTTKYFTTILCDEDGPYIVANCPECNAKSMHEILFNIFGE